MSVSDIKRAQKISLLYKTITSLFTETIRDNTAIQGLYITRVELSPDKGMCIIYFYALEGGEEFFKDKFHELKLYKPSLRAALARYIPSRYTPDIMFKYDTQQNKVARIEELLSKVRASGDLDTDLESNNQK